MSKKNALSSGRSLLGSDAGGLVYKSAATNFLQIYFLTGFLANFDDLVVINNVALVIFVVCTFLVRRVRAPTFSPMILIYAALTVISVLNHLRWYPEAGIPQGARTMPIVLFAMIACRMCTTSGLFERGVLMNTLPFALLIPLGAQITGGRFYSEFLSENIQGAVLPFAFAVGVSGLWHKRYSWKVWTTLTVPLLFMTISARRSMLFYIIGASLMMSTNGLFRGKFSFRKVVAAGLALGLVFAVAVPIMVDRQADRFGAGFHLAEHVSTLVKGEAVDRSSAEREGFIRAAFEAVSDRWLGFGGANFPLVVAKYGDSSLSIANNPHSGLADSLITAGYPGLILYLFLLIYIWRIGRNDMLMSLCFVWLVLSVFIEANLDDRILWPLLAIAERELQMAKKLKKDVLDTRGGANALV